MEIKFVLSLFQSHSTLMIFLQTYVSYTSRLRAWPDRIINKNPKIHTYDITNLCKIWEKYDDPFVIFGTATDGNFFKVMTFPFRWMLIYYKYFSIQQ